MGVQQVVCSRTIVSIFVVIGWTVQAGVAQNTQDKRETHIRAGSTRTIVAVNARPTPPDARADRSSRNSFPRPRLAGFAPFIAIATSDEGDPYFGYGSDYEHVLRDSYVGSPLADPGFVIGYLDSGSGVDLAAGTYADMLGLSGDKLTEYTIGIGGVGGQVITQITHPVGFFAAGLSAIDQNGDLNYGALVGHSNVCGLAAPPIDCGTGEVFAAVIGMPFIAFYNSVIWVNAPQTATVAGVTYTGPEVQILDPIYDPVPTFDHIASMQLSPLPAQTANYFDFPEYPEYYTRPTMLSILAGYPPFNAGFFATIYVLEGEPSPTNPAIPMRVLVDTGAQSSIMSSAMVSALSLPLHADFTVDVCGVGGLVEDVDAYYVDYVKISAQGGPMEFSKAPFVVLDIMGPEDVILDGVLGMNFFWNRNVMFEPLANLGIGFLHASDPIPVAYGDSDVDFDVDADDTRTFASCITGPDPDMLNPDCDHLDGDLDGDVDLVDFARFQACFSGADETADPDCGL